MRNYKDMADAVFRRRDEYVASVKRKKKIALNASLSLCTVCLAVLGAFGIWQSGVLTPDPHVIGTKPQSFTEPTTEGLIHSIGSNATSEGEYTENTQIITGNIITGNTAIDATNPDNSANPTGATLTTDPQEKPVNPALPTIKPTIPSFSVPPTNSGTVHPDIIIPTSPIGPTLPNYPDAPEVPPTSGDYPKPKPPVVLPTDPVEPEVPAATGGDIGVEDEVPDPPTTASPTWAPVIDGTEETPVTTISREDEAVEPTEPTEPIEVTVPCWTQSPTDAPLEEPTMPAAPETQSPTAGIKVYGKVVDQNGNPVAGAKVTLYYSLSNYSTATTNANGEYSFTNVPYYSGIYVKQTYAPSGYTSAANKVYVSSSNDYGSNYIVFVCTKK